jgi:hypothetical protein
MAAMSNIGVTRIPVRSRAFWVLLFLLLVVVLGLTMWKDWWLTGQKPNPLFYLVVLSTSMLVGAVIASGVARMSKQPIGFLEILAVVVAVNSIMQVSEILLKIVYYRIWEYPGLLYLAIVIPMGLGLMLYGLACWTKLKWSMAVVITVVYFVGELVVGVLMSGIPGLSTPGS